MIAQPAPTPTYAVASDLTGVIRTDDGFGKFPTELAALERLIEMLEGQRETIATNLADAKRRRRRLANARGEA